MSPTPAERAGRYAPVGRRMSTRIATRGHQQAQQQQQYRNLDDSSDDEVLSPMKLSAITKALLGGGHVSDAAAASNNARRTSIPAPAKGTTDNASAPKSPTPSSRPRPRDGARRSSIPAPAAQASDQGSPVPAAGRVTRHSRRESNLSPPQHRSPAGSRETSPAPRKRVVRLQTATAANGTSGSRRNSLRNSFSSSTTRKRPESVERSKSRTGGSSPVVPQDHAAKTPVVPVRTVRIAVGSSGQKPASSASSDGRSKYSTRSAEGESRGGSAAGNAAAAVAPQASLRIKRVGKTPGSFLSGPARRGRRRQSEEDGEGQFDGEPFGSGQEPGSQQHAQSGRERDAEEDAAASAAEYPDFAASGSPVSSKDSARLALRKHKSTFATPLSERKPEHEHRPLAYRIPSPRGAPESPNFDKENDAPSEIEPVIPASMRAPLASMAAPGGAGLASQRPPLQPVASINPQMMAELRHQPQVVPNNHIIAARANQRAPAPPPPPKMSVAETATAAAGASTASQASKKRQFLLRVNGKMYTRIDSLGRGGSGKVYRVSAENGKLLALKRVSLENLDDRTIKGYHGEIDLLQRLTGVNRVIQLIDHEFNAEKKMLSIVLEAGELDFNTFMRSRLSEDCRFDPVFVRYWWKEMVECVQSVHQKDIIHTDLKPANFVLAQGRLKVIDFGIANAIQTDMTVNVHRDAQIGTPNYMSPESLMDSKEYALTSGAGGQMPHALPLHRPKHFKLGKASDVWSLGCILYQMVYGQCPFAKVPTMMARVNAIKDWNHTIEFPEATEHGVRVPPSLIRTLKRCLSRDQTLRPTCDELLAPTDPFLYPIELSSADGSAVSGSHNGAVDMDKAIPITPDLLRDVVWDVAQRVRRGDVVDAEVLQLWPTAYWASCKKSLAAGQGRS
ncbi:kinase-like domain-containing protein [Dichotomopilus funicola]|uniref:Kinase-like domain-containing protein n=1 Tax=Dichotomopilus funicola TaxID=1934379 RepID=A0AAN6ZLX9_9PEZI|nr:kinase-like domain-containing protein [Dichotomopilus funicola]